ncbi:choice-of-anchor D domain-containing protein, partial [bacterium]|nr:choice-of-anchor D domain-containing protein [bacterium]
GESPGVGGTVEHTDTGLSAGTTYTYRVYAFKGEDQSGYSNEATETTFAPDIAIEPEFWTGEVLVDDIEDITFTVSNQDTATAYLAISSIDLTGDTEFTIISGDDPVDPIAPGGTHQIVVRFAPTSEGLQEDTLEITSNDPDTPILPVPLSGTGIAPDISVVPPEGDFGIVDIGEYETANYRDITFEVSNVGDSGTVLDVTSVTLTGTDASEFSTSDDEPFSLTPEDPPHEIVVRFEPTTGGFKEAYLSIENNDPDYEGAPLDVYLYGTGNPLDLIPPEIVEIGLDPPNGSILDIEPQDVTIPFSEPMDTESVLKNSEFVRINITDDVTEMRASICTFLYWFGNPNQADKYNGYGCNPPYGIAPDAGPNGKIDVTFNEPDNDTLTIHIEDLTIGQPDQPITEDTEYLLRILVNGATDLSGNVLALTHLDYTYFLTQQVEVTAGGGSFPSLLHDESLTVNIPGVSENTQLTAYTHFDPADTLPPPLWGEVEEPQIGIIKAFHLELGEEVTFTPPYGIQVQYNDSDIPPGEDENFLRLYQRDENENIWKFLVGSSVDTDNNIVSHNGLDQVNEPITVLGDFAVMWGYPYGDLYVLGSIELFDFQFIIFYVEEYWNIFAPEPGWPGESLDPDMAEIVADLNGDGVINVSDALQIMNYILYDEPFGVFGAPRLMHPLSNVAHTAFLSRDALSNRVSIVLDDATDVFAADIELTYNPRLLKISEVSKTSLTSDSLISYDDRNAGKLRSILVNLPLNGAGSLMDVQFELMPGASRTAAFDSIKLTKVKLNAGLIKTTLGKLPQRLTLLQNYPNPFNPETWIPYELNQAADVEIRIYNINGQIVRRLSLGQQLPGSYITKDKAVYWDGANDKGEKVSSGVYFYQLKAGEKSLVRKMVIMK